MIGRLRAAVAGSALGTRVHHALRDVREARAVGTTRVGSAERRLLIAPVNSAGQAYAWARAAERSSGVAAANFAYRDPGDVFGYPADHRVPTALFRTNTRWQRAQRRAVERRFTHVIVESGRQILGGEGSPADQIADLQSRGIAVALLFHGSDIRTPSVHAERERDSPFRDGRYADTARLEEIAARNHELIARTGAPVLVSTPDLLEHVPQATWLPVVVDVELWGRATSDPPLKRERPVVVHAPSNAGLKGSDLIGETLRGLDADGLLEYRELRGIPAADMPAHYGAADIVLDQFSLGIYGVAACEAMAAGRLVISHVSESTRAEVRDRTGLELPILETRAESLAATLRGVIADRGGSAAFAARGPSFVAAVHGGEQSARVLGGFLGLSTESAQDPAWENGRMPKTRRSAGERP
ncbi:hypothetical protein [Microbacterium flavescens]|uniref:hypothetical protein n=1 Tax=Microbacterium flavescens TaxID=69366 RepID=UPI001BDF29D8|nr:hypothetical protein [Microbacterium flavescens]BFF10649.1 hypothetical protein GCM10025699_19520 [Microbacterium flavescens]